MIRVENRSIAVDVTHVNLLGGWSGIFAGIISGALVGLFFYRDDWLGGYQSYRRRLVRLGHISFFGLGILNILFALSAPTLHLPHGRLVVSSIALLIAAACMPVCCFVTAWWSPGRHLFPIPVGAALVATVAILAGSA